MSEAASETQAAFVIPEMGGQVFSSKHESMDDVERNADLHIFNHELCRINVSIH